SAVSSSSQRTRTTAGLTLPTTSRNACRKRGLVRSRSAVRFWATAATGRLSSASRQSVGGRRRAMSMTCEAAVGATAEDHGKRSRFVAAPDYQGHLRTGPALAHGPAEVVERAEV